MKKIIFFLVIALTCATPLASFAQDPNVIHEIEEKLTIGNVYSDVKDIISAIADGLMVGAEHVYKVLIKQQTINAIIKIGILFILWIGCWIFLPKAVKQEIEFNNEKKLGKLTNDDYPFKLGFLWLFGVIFGLSAFITTLCFINPIITGLCNPEYMVIEDILHMLK